MSFSDLSFERLNKSAPELVKYVVSFVDLQEDLPSDSAISVGIFIVAVGGQRFFIPVIAKGTTAYPIDSVFSEETKSFMPLSKASIEQIINTQKTTVGAGTKTPTTVNKNPSIRTLVEPPRTGKYTYASTGIDEFLAQLTNETKTAFIEKLASDMELTKGLHSAGFDVKEMLISLQPIEKVALEIAPEVSVVTKGENLSDDTVQDILNQGYCIMGEHRSPRTAIEYDPSSDGYTTLENAEEGKAYAVVMKDGSIKHGFVPKMLKGNCLGELRRTDSDDVVGAVAYKGKKTIKDELLIVLETGNYLDSRNTVIKTEERDVSHTVSGVVSSCGKSTAKEVSADNEKTRLIITGDGCFGPIRIFRKEEKNGAVTLSYQSNATRRSGTIKVMDNLAKDAINDGDDLCVKSSATIITLKDNILGDAEYDVMKASRREDAALTYNILKQAMEITFDQVEYAVDGKPVGSRVKLAEELAVNQGISKQATEAFISKATAQGKVKLMLSKEAGFNNQEPVKGEIPQYGQQPSAQPKVSDKTKTQVNKASGAIKKSLKTKDKPAIEATIISEFMNDPNIYETIETYLPKISEATDRLGRAILLLRLNSEDIVADIDTEELSNLLTSLRHTYRVLGDNKIKLEQLTSNGVI